jgi:GT2 family glycosyltransferase
MAKVSVIIVNYNGQLLLGELFESLARQTRLADEVIMVDNASADGSVEFVRGRFPWVKVIAWPTNVGFAEGCNIGVANALGEYIGLLNPDAVADERWLAELVQALEANENIAGADSKIYRADEHMVIEEAGAGFNNLGYLWPFGFNQADRGQFSAMTEVPAFTACAGLLRRRALEGEPLFDRRLFMYNEEFDLTLRLRSRGYSIVFAPTSVVSHRGSQSVAKASQKPLLFKRFYHDRNRIKILAKYYPVSVLIRSLPLIFLSFAYGDWQFLRYGGPLYLLRAKTAQVQYAFQGLIERLRGPNIKAEKWLLWMEYHGLRDMFALKSSRGDW